MEREIKLIWDFRGPKSLSIARHHEIHLKEFIIKNSIEEYKTTGVETLNDMHSLAYWIIPESQIKVYRDILRPHRATVYNKE